MACLWKLQSEINLYTQIYICMLSTIYSSKCELLISRRCSPAAYMKSPLWIFKPVFDSWEQGTERKKKFTLQHCVAGSGKFPKNTQSVQSTGDKSNNCEPDAFFLPFCQPLMCSPLFVKSSFLISVDLEAWVEEAPWICWSSRPAAHLPRRSFIFIPFSSSANLTHVGKLIKTSSAIWALEPDVLSSSGTSPSV